MSPRLVPLVSSALALLLCARPGPAAAYPTSVVFAPSADVRALGEVGTFLYAALALAPGSGASQGPVWLGAQIGVLPRLPYGSSGLSFGGAEIGIDAILSDLAGTPDAYIKPVLNAKVQVLAEGRRAPGVALGLMQLSLVHDERSLNGVYGVASKSLSLRGRGLGRLTLGLGASLGGARDADRYAQTQPVFYSTAPFPRSSGLFLIAGYESPPLGPFGFAIDHVGGVSEISATNIAISVSAVAGTTLGVGGYLGSDPAAFYGGLFVYLFSVLDLPALLRRRP